jgi:hypothetical protein
MEQVVPWSGRCGNCYGDAGAFAGPGAPDPVDSPNTPIDASVASDATRGPSRKEPRLPTSWVPSTPDTVAEGLDAWITTPRVQMAHGELGDPEPVTIWGGKTLPA